MSVPQKKAPVYDQRVQEIIRGLTEGKNREDIAKSFGYSGWRSADMYMRRHGFVWEKQNYVPATTKVDELLRSADTTAPPKAALVISLLTEGTPDPRAVSRQVGFTDHREMADYMKRKGYVWSSEKGNYVEFAGEVTEEAGEVSEPWMNEAQVTTMPNVRLSEPSDLADYLPLLEMLARNKERLLDLLMPASETGMVPHFAVPGSVRTKSVYMSDLLASLMGEFCEGRNISQKQAFEGAVIEYLRRYGFKREIEVLLKKA